MLTCRHVIRPHCFIQYRSEACSCHVMWTETAYFVGKKSKNRLVCKNAFAFGLLWELQTPSKGLLAQLRVCWLRGKNTLPVALPGVQLVREEATLPASSWFLLGSSYAECYGQLLAGLGKGGKLESSIKPEEQTSTLNRRGLQSLSIVL